MARVKVGDYEYESRTPDYVAPPGSPPVGTQAPIEPSRQARALARVLAHTRMADAGDGNMLPQYFAPRAEVMNHRYGEGNWTPQEFSSAVINPTNTLGQEYLRDQINIIGGNDGGAFAANIAGAVTGGDSDEDMMARNMTRFMRRYQNYVSKDDLALALAEIFEPAPGAVPGRTGSGTQTGQSDKAGSVGGANTPEATIDGMISGGANAANVFGTLGFANFARGLYNSMQYGSPFRNTAYSPFPEMDQYGNAIPGTEIAINTQTWGDDTSGPSGSMPGAAAGADGPSGGGGGIST